MNIYLGKEHLDTLRELQNLAEKHGGHISMGFNNNLDDDIDWSILESEGIGGKIIRELKSEENCIIKNAQSGMSEIWFALYDKNNKCHSMSYYENWTQFDCEEFGWEVPEKFSEFLDNNEYGNRFYYSDSPTIISGFGNKEKVEDYRVYRSGMAVKFFSDLVCDYLGEERIVKTY